MAEETTCLNNENETKDEAKTPLQDDDEVVALFKPARDDQHTPKEMDIEIEIDDIERDQWSNELDFILTLVGYAVGVSNLWRFPYLCLRNGGGAFLIPFFFFLFLCGVPLFYLEVCLGQFSGISSIFVWRLCPIFKGIGYGMVVVSGFACIYYNAVLSWVIYYLVNSFQADLPWASCGHWWNTPLCIKNSGEKSTWSNMLDCNHTVNYLTSWPLSSLDLSFIDLTTNVTSAMNATAVSDWLQDLISSNQSFVESTFNINASLLAPNVTNYYFSVCCNGSSLCLFDKDTRVKPRTAGEEFWQFNVLRKTEGLENLGSLQLHSSFCLLAAWILVCLCLIKGVKSLGKVVYVTALLPYVLLTIFLIRGLMLPGSLDGIRFYVEPDFSKLANFNVWIEACLQVFYSLGPAWGGLITMSSFNKFDNNCFRDVMIASLADGLTSFYGGFVIFSVVGFMAHEAKASVVDIATKGPGLALVAYPEAISKLPFPQLWAVLFFFMLLLLGLDSQFGMFETVVVGLMDAFPQFLRKKRMILTVSLALISFCISLPVATQGGIYVFTLLDWYVAAFCVMFISLLECTIITWIYGLERFGRDINMMMGHHPNAFFKICWAFVTPLIMLMAFISTCITYTLPVYDGYVYPGYANAIGFIISFIPLIPILGVAAYVLLKEKGSLSERLQNAIHPSSDWGPAPKKLKAFYRQQQASYPAVSKFSWMRSLFRGVTDRHHQ